MRPFVPSLGCCVYLELVTWEALLTQGHSADILARTWLTIVKAFTLFHIFIKSIYQPYQVLVFVRGVNSYNCNLLKVQRLLKSLKVYIVYFTATVLCLKLIAMKIKAFLHDFLCKSHLHANPIQHCRPRRLNPCLVFITIQLTIDVILQHTCWCEPLERIIQEIDHVD